MKALKSAKPLLLPLIVVALLAGTQAQAYQFGKTMLKIKIVAAVPSDSIRRVHSNAHGMASFALPWRAMYVMGAAHEDNNGGKLYDTAGDSMSLSFVQSAGNAALPVQQSIMAVTT